MRKIFDIAAFCINKKECWFFAKEFNCLFYKNLDSGQTIICGPVPWEDNKKEMLYKEMEYMDGKVYLIPFRARNIAVYDIANKNYYKLKLNQQIVSKRANYFRAGLIYNQYIYAFGIHVPAIIVIDTTTDKIEYLTNWYKEVAGFLTNNSKALFRKQTVVIHEKAYVPMAYGDLLLAVDLKEKKITVNHMNFKTSGYSGVSNDGENIYLVERDGRGLLGSWNCETKDEKVIGFLNQDGEEVDKYLAFISPNIEVYYMKHNKSQIKNQFIRNKESDCDCLLSNGQANAFLCDDGKVLLIANEIKKKIDVSVEISKEDNDYLHEFRTFFRESKWYGIKQLIEEFTEK